MNLYTFTGTITKTKEQTTIYVNSTTRELAEVDVQKFATEVEFVRVEPLSQDWG